MPKFDKRDVMIGGVNPVSFPAIQIGPEHIAPVVLQSGKTIMATFAEVLSLRTTNPFDADGNPQEVTQYPTVTTENLRFTPLRFNHVANLDYDPETKAAIGLDVLMGRVKENIASRQAARALANATQVISLTDEAGDIDPDLAPA